MTQVTETIIRPDGTPAAGLKVRFTLAGATRAFASDDDETVLPVVEVVTDQDGEYLVDLPANSELNPAGTRWRRSFGGRDVGTASDEIIVPVSGGPYVVEDILAAPLVPVPSTAESNLIVSATSGAQQTLTVESVFNVYPVAGTTIAIDTPLDFMVELRGRLTVRHDDEDFASVVVAIAPPGETLVGGHVGQQTYMLTGEKGIPGTVTSTVQARLDPGITGSWQLYVTSVKPGNVTVIANGAELAAYRV